MIYAWVAIVVVIVVKKVEKKSEWIDKVRMIKSIPFDSVYLFLFISSTGNTRSGTR